VAHDVTSADDLYALDPGDFVAARTALAKRLRADGEKDEAARVAKLRRPSTAAAALNRAAREHTDLLEAALTAGQELRSATEAALAGDASQLRGATTAERAATDRFLAAASGYLSGGGAAASPRLAATLRAAVMDDAVADELRRGVLSADHEAAPFGFATGMDLAAPAATPPAPTKRKATGRRSAEERDATAAAERAERERVAEEERKRFEERRRRAEQEREVERLERSADRLARRADEAEAAADAARAEADAAAGEAAEARAALDP
jgi:hypothetical protein